MVITLKAWLTQRKRRDDEARLGPVLSDALEFVGALKREAGEGSGATRVERRST